LNIAEAIAHFKPKVQLRLVQIQTNIFMSLLFLVCLRWLRVCLKCRILEWCFMMNRVNDKSLKILNEIYISAYVYR